jgi:hypothetical protein
MNISITHQLINTLKLPSHASWSTVYEAAIKKGECADYARFLADEHCRLNGIVRDVDN